VPNLSKRPDLEVRAENRLLSPKLSREFGLQGLVIFIGDRGNDGN
jgi:hypothetical protein